MEDLSFDWPLKELAAALWNHIDLIGFSDLIELWVIKI